MNKPRKSWVAVLLTFLAIGLGHIYCGKAQKGIILFVIAQLFTSVGFSFLLLHPPVGIAFSIIITIIFFSYCVIDSYKSAKTHNAIYSLKKYNKWYVYLLCWFLGSIVLSSVTSMTIKNNIVQAYKIPSGAMLQTLQIGDHIICNKFIYKRSEPKRDDVVVFQFPKDPKIDYIKRIIAVGGDVVEIKNKMVLINGSFIDDKHSNFTSSKIMSIEAGPRDNLEPITVPNDSVFVLGDNRDNSYDSRFWGFVKKSKIKGRAKYIYWSWNKDKSAVRWDRIFQNIK